MKYFVSYKWRFYVFDKICESTGNTQIERNKPINSMKDILEIEQEIAQTKDINATKYCGKTSDVTIINWQQFEDQIYTR